MPDYPYEIESDLPCGLDRADGKAPIGPEGGPTNIGTPTADGQIIVTSAGGEGIDVFPTEEFPDSPTLERAEQATCTHRFRMTWEEAVAASYIFARGGIRTDSFGDMYKMLSASWQREKGGLAIMTTTEESISYDSPPDSFEVTPVELGLHILKHPRYFHAFLGSGYGSQEEQANQMVIRLLQDYMENTSAAYRNALTWMLNESMGSNAGNGTQPPQWTGDKATVGADAWDTDALVQGTDMAKAAALEIIQKYWRGEETPSVVGWKISWSSFYFNMQELNPGGYIEDPIVDAVPQLPEYFWSPFNIDDPNYGNTDYTIFSKMGEVNPQLYAQGGTGDDALDTVISWRREADQIDYQRTWFRVTRSWVGSPIGFWDPQLYTQFPRPEAADDYLAIGV